MLSVVKAQLKPATVHNERCELFEKLGKQQLGETFKYTGLRRALVCT